jgi:hypothetical protein
MALGTGMTAVDVLVTHPAAGAVHVGRQSFDGRQGCCGTAPMGRNAVPIIGRAFANHVRMNIPCDHTLTNIPV